jgi:hypothetical protein
MNRIDIARTYIHKLSTYIGAVLEIIGKYTILGIYRAAVWVEKTLRPHV